jgi:hypothetical protein
MSAVELQALAVSNETESQYNKRVAAEAAREAHIEAHSRMVQEQSAIDEQQYQKNISTIKQTLYEEALHGKLIICVMLPHNFNKELVDTWFLREPEWRMPVYTRNPLSYGGFVGVVSYCWFDLRAHPEIKPIK